MSRIRVRPLPAGADYSTLGDHSGSINRETSFRVADRSERTLPLASSLSEGSQCDLLVRFSPFRSRALTESGVPGTCIVPIMHLSNRDAHARLRLREAVELFPRFSLHLYLFGRSIA
jgi:hypothetical protein